MDSSSKYFDFSSTWWAVIFMVIAYVFSFAVRMIWVYHFKDTSSFYWNGQLMINTNDGYYFASGAQKILYGLHLDNPGLISVWKRGLVFTTVLLAKITPFSLDTIILYMPAVFSSLIVIPIVLIGKLYGNTFWGFMAALLASITWSYYNRTMTGYYDTDLFSVMVPMFILYFLIKSTIDLNVRTVIIAAVLMIIYPVLYFPGNSLTYAMAIIYGAYMIWYHRDQKITYILLILIYASLIPAGVLKPYNVPVQLIFLLVAYLVLHKRDIGERNLKITTIVTFVIFLIAVNALGMIYHRIISYMIRDMADVGLHFYNVKQTIREAGHIPFVTFANRISGSQLGLLLAAVGYLLLVIRHRAFLLALPLVGIGIFANWGGLRFTVYAVPVAAMSAVYLFFVIGEFFRNTIAKYAFVTLATAAMLYPNIVHVIDYRTPTVFTKSDVADLELLKKISSPKDYTLTWWDYGYPVWYYSNTNTLLDGGKHNNDNFIISKIMQTDSPQLAANLARVAVETYVDSNYSIVADTLFHNKQPDQKDPNLVLAQLESGDYPIPPKSRDIYLYVPLYRMLGIYPTVMVFGNLDLNTGKRLRKPIFIRSKLTKIKDGLITLANGVLFDSSKGTVQIGSKKSLVKFFATTANRGNSGMNVKVRRYRVNGNLAVIWMKSYKEMLVVDLKTYNSMFVQMFLLGKYDKKLFEPVVFSPYSRIYKLKI